MLWLGLGLRLLIRTRFRVRVLFPVFINTVELRGIEGMKINYPFCKIHCNLLANIVTTGTWVWVKSSKTHLYSGFEYPYKWDSNNYIHQPKVCNTNHYTNVTCINVVILSANENSWSIINLAGQNLIMILRTLDWRKEMFYLTMHSPHNIYGYMASDIW